MDLKQQYDDFSAASLATGLSMDVVDPVTGEVTKDLGYTQQEFALDADINEIVRRFGLTGRLPDVNNVPQSGDFVGVSDYHSAMLALRKADEGFLELPADVRARFSNDPQLLMDFLDNADNRDEAVKLGLVSPPKVEPRSAVAAIDELAAKWTASVPKGGDSKP